MLVGATILFSLTIVCLTVTQSLVLTLWILIPLFLMLAIFGYIKKLLRQIVAVFFATTFIAFVSVRATFTHYNTNIFTPAQQLIQTSNGYHTVIATGTIIEKQTHNRYLWKSFTGVPFFLYTSKKHTPGDEILLTARAQPAIDSSVSLFVDHDIKLERFITQWSDYSFDFASWQIMKGVAGSLHESNSIVLSKTPVSRINQWRSSIQSSSATTYVNDRTQ